MRKDEPVPDFQVYCHRCRVTFPMGARSCVHCGGRLSKEAPSGAGALPRAAPARMALPELMEAEMELEDEAPEGAFRRRGIFSPVALMWIVLAVAMTIYRACTGTPG